jgi:hypothetical protein
LQTFTLTSLSAIAFQVYYEMANDETSPAILINVVVCIERHHQVLWACEHGHDLFEQAQGGEASHMFGREYRDQLQAVRSDVYLSRLHKSTDNVIIKNNEK